MALAHAAPCASSAAAATTAAASAAAVAGTAASSAVQVANVNAKKSNVAKKKICCACPDTKQARDECIVMNGEEACGSFIEAHKQCLRREGFNV